MKKLKTINENCTRNIALFSLLFSFIALVLSGWNIHLYWDLQSKSNFIANESLNQNKAKIQVEEMRQLIDKQKECINEITQKKYEENLILLSNASRSLGNGDYNKVGEYYNSTNWYLCEQNNIIYPKYSQPFLWTFFILVIILIIMIIIIVIDRKRIIERKN